MRLFLAVPLPADLRAVLAGTQQRLRRELAGWRWTRPGAIHLTLRFLGEVEESAIEGQSETWAACVSAVVRTELDVGGIGAFPPRGAPRVLWTGLREAGPAGSLTRLAAELERGARDLGFEPVRREFRPHLTLARARRDDRPRRPRGDELGRLGRLAVERVVLTRSVLHPSGARYTALREFALGSRRDG